MTWQTIETAPSDTPVLVYDGEYISIAYFDGEWTAMANGGCPAHPMDEGPVTIYKPSHWMPLPEPPK